VIQNPKYIFISQKKYIGELLKKISMDECNHISSPMEWNLKLTSKEGMNLRMQPSTNNLWEFLSTFIPSSCKNLVNDICPLQKDF
jgi:hypothetical protein